MTGERTRYGSGPGTGAASLDMVILDIPLGREFTEAEVTDEVRRRGLPERGAVGQHLRALRERGFIRKSDNGWVRIS
jgi:repressor of nif and glnA expression